MSLPWVEMASEAASGKGAFFGVSAIVTEYKRALGSLVVVLELKCGNYYAIRMLIWIWG